jgi:hypothetical protein
LQVTNVAITVVVAALVAYLAIGPDATAIVVLAGLGAGVYVSSRPRPRGGGRTRVGVLAVVNALVLLVANAFLTIAFGFGACGGDGGTPYSAAGSDRDAYCDFLANHAGIELLLVLAAPLLVLGFGLYAARRRDNRALLGTLLAGVALTLVVHVPPWFLSAG